MVSRTKVDVGDIHDCKVLYDNKVNVFVFGRLGCSSSEAGQPALMVSLKNGEKPEVIGDITSKGFYREQLGILQILLDSAVQFPEEGNEAEIRKAIDEISRLVITD